MKDKSRFVSSIIVSLLAGFIYYQFGDNIKEIQSSVKAVLSYSDADMYLPIAPQSFNSTIKNSGNKSSKKKSKFYIKKKNTIEFKTKDAIVPGDEMLSDFISKTQAKIKRATPDKNIDFTSELEHLIKSDLTKSTPCPNKEIKSSKSLRTTTNEVSDVNSSKTRINRTQVKFDKSQKNYKQEYYTGYGFEYNYIINENSTGSSNSSTTKGLNQLKGYNKFKRELKKTQIKKVKCESKNTNVNGEKVIIITPKAKVNKNNSGIDVEEINIHDSCGDESM